MSNLTSNLTRGQKLYQELDIDNNINSHLIPLNDLDLYVAIKYFLTLEDEEPENAKNIKKIDRYLCVFRNLCEVSEWQKAGQVLSFCYTSKPLHEQLRIWGYYREEIELYQQLLGKVNSDYDIIYLYGLGRAFYNLSDYDQSLIYYQELLKLAKLINNGRAEALALDGLGNIQYINYNFDSAISYFQQQLDIANAIEDQEQQGYALENLGYVFYFSGLNKGKYNDQQKGLHYLENALEMAVKLNDQEMESLCIDSINQIYFNRGDYNKSLTYLFRQLTICQENNDKGRQAGILGKIGRCYVILKQSDQAMKYCQLALITTREIGNKWEEAKILNDLGVIYCYKLKQYQEAIFYFEQALAILQKIKIQLHPSVCAANISICYSYLKNQEKSVFYLNIAKSLVTELESVETKGVLIMSIANSYWLRDKIWYKAWGILLAIKALMIIPPWRSANGRLAMQLAIKQIFGK